MTGINTRIVAESTGLWAHRAHPGEPGQGMMAGDMQRKLTTILAADAAGYSEAMGRDEVRTVAELRAARDVFGRFVTRHGGRIANTAGDGLIADFPSVVEAVQCAIEVQGELKTLERSGRDPLLFRIGIHLGDVIVDGADLLGDGVNIAARLESMAEPGGVLISQQVYDQVANKLQVGFEYLGEKRPRNLASEIAIYRVSVGGQGILSDPRPAILRQPVDDRTLTVADPVAPSPSSRPPRASEPASSAPAPPADAVSLLRRSARPYAIVAAALFGIDLVTGLPFWSQWPILGLLVLFGWCAAPSLERGRIGRKIIRTGILAAGFLGLNLLSPEGGFWSIWPAGALAALAAVAYFRASPT